MGQCEQGSGFGSKLMGVKWLNIVLIILVAMWTVFGITEIIIGAVYFDECKEEELMPVWLIVDAVIPIFFVIGFVLHLKEGSSDTLKLCGTAVLIFATIATITWSILGAVWIYPNSKGDCDDVLRIFSTVMISFNWSMIWMWTNIAGRLIYCHCKSRHGEKS